MKDRVRKLCELKGVTAEIAEKEIGLSRGYISKLNKSNPNSKTVDKICEYFEVSREYLLKGEASEGFSPEEAHLLQKIRQDRALSDALAKYFELSDVKKKHIIETINLLSEG